MSELKNPIPFISPEELEFLRSVSKPDLSSSGPPRIKLMQQNNPELINKPEDPANKYVEGVMPGGYVCPGPEKPALSAEVHLHGVRLR